MKASTKNSILIIAAILIILSGLIYWWSPDKKNPEKTAEESSITLTDTLGRKVSVPRKIERVACLYAFTGHVTVMLGQGEKIVAVPGGLKRDVLLNQICPTIKNASVPSSNESINIEELLRVKPDLVLINRQTGINKDETAKLDRFDLPYLVIDFQSMEEQRRAVNIIGKVLSAEKEALAYSEYYLDCIKRVSERVKDIPEDQRLRVYHSVNEATRTDPPNSLPADWMKTAGLINVSVNQTLRLIEGKNFASLEQILLWDPEVILVNEPGVAEYILKNTQWSSLNAVKTQKVYQMPVGISRWGHPGGLETPLALLWTAQLLYPEQFMDMDIKQESRTFYKEFFDLQVDDATLDRILAGQGMRLTREQGGETR
ncbi:MAG: ABC transporter substrate-binding protein [Syntrophomonadaceae bacterium]|nr:ABC transporter substrate-binding protein [Syntrophomonadaceae bacterium]